MSDYETGERRRNMTVGVFVLTAICVFVFLIFKFADLPVFVSKWASFTIRVQFATAPGVQENTPVRFCGYQVGKVTEVKPPKILKDINTGQSYHQTEVVLSIDKKYSDIPADVEVKLMTRGLGSSYIELKAPLPDVNQPVRGVLTDGSLLQGSTGMTSEFFPEESQEKLEQLVTGIGALVDNANDILGDAESKENLKSTLANLSEATKQAVQTLKEFQEFAVVGTETLKNAGDKVEKVLTAMVDTSEELTKTLAQLRVILEKIDSGQGSAAKLINDGRLYENLLENTQQIQFLLEELNSFVAEWRDKGVPIKLK